MENQVYCRKGAVTTLQLTTLAILLAIRFALDYLPEIDLGVTKMGFGFVGAALTGAIAGPIPAMILGAAHDILKFALGGAKGVYFPGYTLTAIVGGLIYGLGLHRQTKTPLRIFLTVLAVTLICNLGLNTLWTMMVQKKAIMAILPVRFNKNMASLVVNSVALYYLFNNEPIKRLIGQIQFPSLLRKK